MSCVLAHESVQEVVPLFARDVGSAFCPICEDIPPLCLPESLLCCRCEASERYLPGQDVPFWLPALPDAVPCAVQRAQSMFLLFEEEEKVRCDPWFVRSLSGLA